MNEPARQSRLESDAGERIGRLIAAQRSAIMAAPCPAADERIRKLKALKRQLARYQDLLADAMCRDFGYRSHTESKILDLLGTTLAANHAISHVRRWMRPSRRRNELLLSGNGLRVHYQPKGMVGIVVPWNFPVYLAFGPLIAALAAGNRAMLKMPPSTPATNAVLERLLGEVFAEDEVALVGEELTDPATFSAQPFDHIVFTGSSAVGRTVMRTAAENLIPVTLELGGKSPAVVTRNYPLADAARRVAHGKVANCGQVCVSPDYALVPREHLAGFVAAAKDAYVSMFGATLAGNDLTWVVDDRHAARLNGLLNEARAKGAKVTPCAHYLAERDGRRMPLHIVTDCTPDMRIMQEELFGPVLPVIPYDTLDDAIRHINGNDRPLALYCFSRDAAERDELRRRTHSGGVTFNDWCWHVVSHDAPFGGIGESGMGNYHGEEGFRELSHARTVFTRRRFFPTHWFQPPYGNFVQRLTLRLFLGKADPTLKTKDE
ncbi:MAG: coniferyl aldehyde dehydrogenase [Nitrosomonadales bacterium]|nr:coniferyl aldehyde dehydrogenase [Nitrosomonadales bacterium]